jgi:protein-S-isoprenylcysteine O-methyltransferase Ste14
MNTFRILFTIAFLLCFFIAGSYRRKAQAGEKFDTSGEGKIYRPLRLFGLIIWLYPIVYIINPAWVAWSLFPLPDWVRWLGAAVGILFVPPMIAWTQRSLGRNVSTTVIIRDGHRLVTHGPYRWVRHPLYSLGTLFFLSLALIAGSWFLLAVMVCGAPLLLARTPIEEAKLIEQYGDQYRDYMKRTGRFFPKFS